MRLMYLLLGTAGACSLLAGLLLRSVPFAAVVLAFTAGFCFGVFVVCGAIDLLRARGLVTFRKG